MFRGGWTAEAAAEVCDEPSALEYLTQLRGHSLAHTYMAGPNIRFGMLETLREFAVEQLGEESEVIRERHTALYAGLAAEAALMLPGAEQAVWIARLDAESARTRSVGHDALLGKRTASIANSFGAVAVLVGPRPNGGGVALDPGVFGGGRGGFALERAEAKQNLGNLSWRDGNEKRRSLSIARRWRCVSPWVTGKGRAIPTGIGNACRALHRADEAQAAYEQGLQIFRELDDKQGIATSLLNMGTLSEDRHDLKEAFRVYYESLILYRELGDLHSQCLTLATLQIYASTNKLQNPR